MVIKVVDSIMGSGKSTWSHTYMYEQKEKKFIYITPYLDEIDRLLYEKDENGKVISYKKHHTERKFREPKHLGEGKLESLHYLLINDYNIATTHSLFKLCNEQTIELIKAGEYTLILDESMDLIDFFDIAVKDYELLLKNNIIKEDKFRKIVWLDDSYDGKFVEEMAKCKNGDVVKVKVTNKVHLLAWNFNVDSFLCFKEAFIMTYIFDASLMKYYFDMHNIRYKKYCVQEYQLVPFENKKPYNKQQYRDLIEIYEGNLNTIGNNKTALSLNWFKKNKDLRQKLKNNIYNYIQNIANAKCDEIMWTTFKSIQKYLKGKGYSESFVSCNARATNDYRDKFIIAYCCNRFLSPDYGTYFSDYGVEINEDMYALSEMLQFIWRSSIRDEKPISVYIPSKRMRNLLYMWLNNENL